MDLCLDDSASPVVLIKKATLFVVYTLIGWLYYRYSCGYTHMHSIFFTVYTITTIGYGDAGYAVANDCPLEYRGGSIYSYCSTYNSGNITDGIKAVGPGNYTTYEALVSACTTAIGDGTFDPDADGNIAANCSLDDLCSETAWRDGAMIFTAFYIIVALITFAYALGTVLNWFFTGTERYIKKGYKVVAKKDAAGLMTTIIFFVIFFIAGILFYYIAKPFDALGNTDADDNTILDADFAAAFYFAIVTLSTLGYGGFTASTDGSIVFTMVWVLLGVALMSKVLGDVLQYMADKEQAKIESQIMRTALVDPAQIAELDEDGGGSLDRYEFLRAMLLKTGRVSKDFITNVMKKFDKLDKDGQGTIDTADFDE